MEQYYLCECGAEFDYSKLKLTAGDNADIEVCPDCGMHIADWMIQTYDERRL